MSSSTPTKQPTDPKGALHSGSLDAIICLFTDQKGRPFVPTDMQRKIISAIVTKRPRVMINCMTRYGKSFCVSIAILILAIMRNQKIVIIAPTQGHTDILMRYVSSHLGPNAHPIIRNAIVDKLTSGKKALSQEVSKQRITFKNGSEVFIKSADIMNRGRQLIGWGADVVVVDECEQIPEEIVRSVIMRMLGDSEDSSAVFISNPSAAGFMYTHHKDERWEYHRVGWETAMAEGRISQKKVDEYRETMAPNEFTIYYESTWPESYDDQLIPTEDIKACMPSPIVEQYLYYGIQGNPYNKRNERKIPFMQFEKPIKKILGVDVATTGADKTVFVLSDHFRDGTIIAYDIRHYDRTEAQVLCQMVYDLHRNVGFDEIRIDSSGIGNGVYTTLTDTYNLGSIVIPVLGGGKPVAPQERKRFFNTKSLNYWNLRQLFVDRKIHLPYHERLYKNLVSFGIHHRKLDAQIEVLKPRDRSKTYHINVLDNMPSPDFADALCYACAHIIHESPMAISSTTW